MATWADVLAIPASTILHDEHDEGLRFIVMRGPVSLCAYVGIPLDHPLAGHAYDDLPVRVHGGLTYSGASEGRPKGYYWYGWDYAHAGDACTYDRDPESDDLRWTLEDVVKDSWEARYDFKHLLKLAESIAAKVKHG